ncbi:o-succinylbenzoate--CoA ligase [Solibacillus sp. R5-41]|uniref:class I adenylate-forming enzyme family protein n=1 Tax=Solibacillus sp. R5-41 TaxID=2048654 RepID=UPI000C126C30|nr:AMP-binding protein [Solibacillus sp. R5-41]ATP41557.1 o-succinylbenzoate--CoA ligase [Solibacillus sp. R5-41]
MNTSELLTRAARKYPQQTAIQSMGQAVSYAALNFQANQLAQSMQQQGIVKGDKVAIFMPNVTEFVVSYFAIAKLGAIVVPMNAKFTATEIEFVLNHADAKAIIAHALIFESAKTIDFNGLKVKTGDAFEQWLSFESLLTGTGEDLGTALTEDDDSTLLYTSGTTGNPKGVLLTHRSVLAVSTMIAIEMEVKPESKLLLMMPLSHSAPLNLFLITSILVGATAVLTPTFTPDLLLETVQTYKTTHFFGAPVAYLLTASSPKLQDYDLTSMKWWVYGGAPLSEKEILFVQDKFTTDRLVCVYGLTEAGPSGSILLAADHPQRAGSIGKRAPYGTELRIVNDQFEDVAAGEVGEIVLHGEGNMKEYYKNPEATQVTLQNGWIRSGDLAKIDEDGYVYIVDRKKDVIFSGGITIYPKEIEDVLLQIEPIFEVAVIGVPHVEWGETVKVIYAAKQTVSEAEIRDYLCKHLASYKIPRLYEQVEVLPRNASGKILKHTLKGDGHHAGIS